MKKATRLEQYVIDRVRELREEKNIGQAELAYMIDVTPGFIGNVESPALKGKYHLRHIERIAEALGVAPAELFPDKRGWNKKR